jgi:hypothetical protein
MGTFSRVEPSYISKDGCRLVWSGIDEDDQDVVVLNKNELMISLNCYQKTLLARWSLRMNTAQYW